MADRICFNPEDTAKASKLTGRSVNIRVTNTDPVTRSEAIILDPNGFYKDNNNGQTNPSNITVVGVDKSILSQNRRLLLEGWFISGLRITVGSGQELQFGNTLDVYEDDRYTNVSNRVQTIKPNSYKPASDFQANIVDIPENTFLNGLRSLVGFIEPNTTVNIQLFIQQVERAK